MAPEFNCAVKCFIKHRLKIHAVILVWDLQIPDILLVRFVGISQSGTNGGMTGKRGQCAAAFSKPHVPQHKPAAIRQGQEE